METQKIFNGSRFDLFAKHIYVTQKLLGIDSEWYVDLYKDHIMVFNGGRENTKTCVDDFVRCFDELIESVKKHGIFDDAYVEVNGKGVLVNNAHRFVTAMILKKPIKIVILHSHSYIMGYDYKFFTNRLNYGPALSPSMKPEWLDKMALHATLYKPNTKVITIYPIADTNKDNEVENLLNENGKVFYMKTVKLTDRGLLNYIEELYLGEVWIGYTRNDKTRDTQGPHPVRVMFYTPDEKTDITTLKTRLRGIYGSRNAVHINDTHSEAIRYAKAILGSIHYLNHGYKLSHRNMEMFQEYKSMIESVNDDFLCIDSSFVMAFYGLREANDLDFLHINTTTQFPYSESIHSHNSEIGHYDKSLSDIIFDPRNHFYVNGVKVASLKVVYDMKRRRGEEKDLRDIKLIENIS